MKSDHADVSIIIDPYKDELATAPRSISADIALFTRGEEGAVTLTNDPFVLSTSGECEIKGVLIYAREGDKEGHNLLRINAEQMSVGHLSAQKEKINDKQLEMLSEVDVLLLPVGGEEHFTAAEAAKAVSHIEPRVVIPYGFQSKANPKATPVSDFVKELGVVKEDGGNKVILKKKDLPQENMKLIVLDIDA